MSPSRPVGRSRANTTALRSRRRVCRDRTAERTGSRRGPDAPMPSNPSSTTSAEPTSAASPARTGAAAGRSSYFFRVSGLHVSGANAGDNSRRQPARDKYRAATRASPPLWPLPKKTLHRPGCGKKSRTTSAIWRPASSMRASADAPLSKARRSKACICEVLNTMVSIPLCKTGFPPKNPPARDSAGSPVLADNGARQRIGQTLAMRGGGHAVALRAVGKETELRQNRWDPRIT